MGQNKWKKIGVFSVAVVFVFLMAMGPAQAAENQTINIGAVLNMTGWLNVYGIASWEGVKLAAKTMNAKGGMAGKYQIKVAAKDCRSEIAPAVPATQEFLADGVNVLYAGGIMDQFIAAAQLAAPKGIMTVTIVNSSPQGPLAVPKGYGFTNTISDSLMSTAMAMYALEKGYKKVFLLRSPDDPYFDLGPKYFGLAFEKMGGKVVGTGQFSMNQTEFGVEVSKIKKLDPQPDLIFSFICCGEQAAFLKRLRADGVDIPFWGADVCDDPSFFGLGEIAEKVYFPSAGAVDPANPPMVKFAELYEKEYGKPLEIASPALGWEVMHLVEQAVINAGSIEPKAIAKAYGQLKDIKFPVGTGSTITLAGTDGNPLRSVAICQVQNGKKKFIKWVTPKAEDVPAP